MIAADTDILIDALRGREPARSRVAGLIGSGRFATTSITAFELLAGARGDNELRRVSSLLAVTTVLPLDTDAAGEAGSVGRELASAGMGIGAADCLIAGICRHASVALLTRSRESFEHVGGLRLASLEM